VSGPHGAGCAFIRRIFFWSFMLAGALPTTAMNSRRLIGFALGPTKTI
jgi:hypothetical protein